MLDPEERNIRYYPRSGKPGDYQPGGFREAGYYVHTAQGTFLNYEKIQRDLDAISARQRSACDCPGECNCDHGNAGGADPYTEAISRALNGIGNIAQAFKKGDAAAEISQRIRNAKQQCPKKPLIALTKAAKARRAAYEQCMASISDKEREFQAEMARLGSSAAASRLMTKTAEADQNKKLYFVLGISAVFILLVITVIIVIIRNRKNKEVKK